MDNFIFSLNATMPIFLVMIVGYILKRINLLNDSFVTVANKFNFTVTLPALLFTDILNADIRTVFDLKYVLYCMIATTVCFFAVWGGAKLFVKDKSIIGAFTQASFRGSAAVLGIAFIQNISGNVGMAPLMIIGAVPLYNIYSVIVLTFEGDDNKESNIKKAFINILKNPIIISIFAGLVCSLSGIDFPKIIDTTLGNFSKMASPLALICIGAGFEGRKAIAKIKPSIAAAFIKLVAQPLILLPVAVALGFTGDKLIAILIMLGAPTTPSCYIMAKNMHNDGVITISIVVLTTLLSAFSITGYLFILKSLGLI